jgi:hypothetical protein
VGILDMIVKLYWLNCITDMIVIALIAYLFTNAILVSIAIGILGVLLIFLKVRLIEKIFIG